MKRSSSRGTLKAIHHLVAKLGPLITINKNFLAALTHALFMRVVLQRPSFLSFWIDIVMTAAIILAAGKSQRMGQNKLLLRLNGGTLLDNVLNAIAAADIQEKVVVVGHNARK